MPSIEAAKASASCCFRVQKRGAHDLNIRRATGKPLVASGPGGRSSQTGSVATVFGATGFLGRYLVSKLAKQGTQVVVPYRDEEEKRHLRVTGDLGQIVPLEWNLRNETTIEECVRHSDVVFNLVGRNYETKNFKFSDVLEEGARRIARIAYHAGVSRFVHLSHLNAVEDSKSRFYQSKARGEIGVRDAFPGATVVRPGPMYGHEDRFLNSIASYPAGWRINGQETVFKPVHVLDVADALKTISNAESTIGTTFSLPGPQPWSIEELIALAEANTVKKLQGLPTPLPVLSFLTKVWEKAVWWPTLSPDEVVRRTIDDLGIPEGHLSWDYLGIEPDLLENQAIVYFRRYRSAAYHDGPSPTGAPTVKHQRYSVIE